MARQSSLPAGEDLSKPMQAFLEKLDSRLPSDASTIDTGTITLPELAARVNQLIQDLNKR